MAPQGGVMVSSGQEGGQMDSLLRLCLAWTRVEPLVIILVVSYFMFIILLMVVGALLRVIGFFSS